MNKINITNSKKPNGTSCKLAPSGGNNKKKCEKIKRFTNELLIIFVLISAISCNSKNAIDKNKSEITEITENKYKMEDIEIKKKFDIATFDQKNSASRYEFIDSNGVEVMQWAYEDFPSGKVNVYIEERNYPNSPYKLTCAYDSEGNIVQSVRTFYRVYYEDVALDYDKNGNVISKTEMDIPCEFSVLELIEKMKQEYEIDLLDKANNEVSRYPENEFLNISVYEVYHVSVTHKDVYLIDGNLGKTLYVTKRPIIGDGMQRRISIVEEYFNSLKK